MQNYPKNAPLTTWTWYQAKSLSKECIDRGLLEEDQRAQFADIVKYFNENLTPLARDLAFLLGFYVKVSSIGLIPFHIQRNKYF